MTRRSYTREFKAEAVRLVNDQGLSCAEAARDLGLHPSVLYRWVKGYGGDSHQGLSRSRATGCDASGDYVATA